MRVQSVGLENYLCHRALAFEVPAEARLTLVAGGNGRGKTAIIEGMRLALTAEPVRGLDLKNEIPQLIARGESSGFVEVSLIGPDDPDDAETYRLSLKTGNYSNPSTKPVYRMDWCVDPRAFLELTLAERRKHMLVLAGVSRTAAVVAEDLVRMGNPKELVEAMAGALAGGFDNAYNVARERASEARGAWKAITGETYGDVKGRDWEPSGAAGAAGGDLRALQAKLETATSAWQRANGELETIQGAERQHEALTKQREQAADLEPRKAARQKLVDELASVEERIKSLEQAQAMANLTTAPCPGCGVVLAITKEHPFLAEYTPSEVSAPQAHTLLRDARITKTDLKGKITTLDAGILAAQAAQQMVETLPKRPTPEAIEAAKAKVRDLNDKRQAADTAVKSATAADERRKQAADKTARARKEHETVQAYDALAQAVKNLPAQYMAKALVEFNVRMHAASVGAPATIHFGSEGEAYLGEIPYWTCSKSQKWRVECAVGYALAKLTGIGFTVLDEFDMIEPAARGALLGWMLKADAQFIVAATLKAKPAEIPGLHLVWLGGSADG